MTSGPEATGKQGGDIWKLALFAVIVLSMIVLARVIGLGERLLELRDWIAAMGPAGMAVYVGLYIVAVLAALPDCPSRSPGRPSSGPFTGSSW
jgi:hypothetical protein